MLKEILEKEETRVHWSSASCVTEEVSYNPNAGPPFGRYTSTNRLVRPYKADEERFNWGPDISAELDA